MPITKYSPFTTEFEDFPAGLRLFQDSLSRLFSEPASSRPWSPAVDIFETENALVLKADLPDVDPKNVGIQLENGTLTLKGERKFENESNGKGFHRIERSYGKFVRAFSLPDTVEGDQVKADYKQGVLTVTLPKKEVARPRTINVEINNN
jgi:HSP20 family protein